MPPTKVYYSDGTIHEGDNPPPRDVQLITQTGPHGRWETQGRSDYYILRDGRWFGVDIFGLFDWLLDSGTVLFGRMMESEAYRELVRKSKEDSDRDSN